MLLQVKRYFQLLVALQGHFMTPLRLLHLLSCYHRVALLYVVAFQLTRAEKSRGLAQMGLIVLIIFNATWSDQIALKINKRIC